MRKMRDHMTLSGDTLIVSLTCDILAFEEIFYGILTIKMVFIILRTMDYISVEYKPKS